VHRTDAVEYRSLEPVVGRRTSSRGERDFDDIDALANVCPQFSVLPLCIVCPPDVEADVQRRVQWVFSTPAGRRCT